VKDHRNVTLSLPNDLLRKFRIYAAIHNRSMSSIITEAITEMVKSSEDLVVPKAERRTVPERD
jgi:plasmid stability protein